VGPPASVVMVQCDFVLMHTVSGQCYELQLRSMLDLLLSGVTVLMERNNEDTRLYSETHWLVGPLAVLNLKLMITVDPRL
jgi:hypothetical protein